MGFHGMVFVNLAHMMLISRSHQYIWRKMSPEVPFFLVVLFGSYTCDSYLLYHNFYQIIFRSVSNLFYISVCFMQLRFALLGFKHSQLFSSCGHHACDSFDNDIHLHFILSWMFLSSMRVLSDYLTAYCYK